jgi:hypothetical protein
MNKLTCAATLLSALLAGCLGDNTLDPTTTTPDVDVDDPVGTTTVPVAIRAESCAEVRANNAAAADGEYQLFVAGDAAKPWKAYCHDMAGTPREYLTIDGATNISMFVEGNLATGTDVFVYWDRIRVDPATLMVDVSDHTFARSTGKLSFGKLVATNTYDLVDVTTMPYATARSTGPWAAAEINLEGTPFGVSDTFPANAYPGWTPVADRITDPARPHEVGLTIDQGGWIGPASVVAIDPINDDGGYDLQLVYIK